MACTYPSPRFQGDDKATLQAAVDEAIRFVEESAEASKEEYEDHMQTLQSTANPIMTRVHSGSGGGSAPGPATGADAGPSVEEVRPSHHPSSLGFSWTDVPCLIPVRWTELFLEVTRTHFDGVPSRLMPFCPPSPAPNP